MIMYVVDVSIRTFSCGGKASDHVSYNKLHTFSFYKV